MSLFKTTDELRELLPVTASFTLNSLQAYLTDAADGLLIPYVGQELYDRIEGKFQADTELNEPEKILLRRMRIVTARFAVAAYLPFGEVMLGDDGLSTIGKGESRTAAYDHQVVRLMESLIRQGYEALERLVTWLEGAAQLTEFPEFAGSDQYTRLQRGLVRKATDFSQIYPIGSNSLTFQAMQPELLSVEEDRLIPLISQAHYDTIKANQSLSDELALLRRHACKAVVYQTVANVILLQQNVQLDAAGLRVYGISPTGTDNVKYYQAPTETARLSAAAQAQGRADFYWDAVSSALNEIINPDGDDDTYPGEILNAGGLTML